MLKDNSENNNLEKEEIIQDCSKVTPCKDGKYRWYYEFPMMKNPTILLTIWQVILIVSLVPALIVFFSSLTNGFAQASKQFLIVYGITFGVMFVLSCLGYLILAIIYGFKYIVLFEMDEESITHIQQGKQFTKAQALSWLTMFVGIHANNPSTVGTGLLASSRQQMTSSFKDVSSVIGYKNNNTIKVNQTFAKNQVYVRTEDYDFVWNFITSRCKKAKIKQK